MYGSEEEFMSCHTSVRHAGSVAIVDLNGSITLTSGIGSIRTAVKGLVDDGHRDILLNLANVGYMDSSGLGEMAGTFTTVANLGGRMRLLKPHSKVDSLLHVTKLYTVMVSFQDESAALSSFQ
jgi:anti-sigma B factor antagonist